jgi:hypothetical protein
MLVRQGPRPIASSEHYYCIDSISDPQEELYQIAVGVLMFGDRTAVIANEFPATV